MRMATMSITASEAFGIEPGRMRFSVRLPVFCHHVSRVVGGGSDKQMARVHAGTVVALMQHPKTLRDLSNGKLIGNAVSAQLSFSLRNPKHAIAGVELGADPHPTIVHVGTDINQ